VALVRNAGFVQSNLARSDGLWRYTWARGSDRRVRLRAEKFGPAPGLPNISRLGLAAFSAKVAWWRAGFAISGCFDNSKPQDEAGRRLLGG